MVSNCHFRVLVFAIMGNSVSVLAFCQSSAKVKQTVNLLVLKYVLLSCEYTTISELVILVFRCT